MLVVTSSQTLHAPLPRAQRSPRRALLTAIAHWFIYRRPGQALPAGVPVTSRQASQGPTEPENRIGLSLTCAARGNQGGDIGRHYQQNNQVTAEDRRWDATPAAGISGTEKR